MAALLDRPHNHLRLHSVDVYVRDQERSLRFYLDKLGFELAFDARLHSGKRLVAVSPPDGTAILTLIEPEPDSAECKLIGRATRIVFVSEDVATQFSEWSSRGVRFRYTPRLRRIKYRKRLMRPTARSGAKYSLSVSKMPTEIHSGLPVSMMK